MSPVTPEERTAQLIAAGTPEFIAKLLVSSQMAIAQGKMGTPTTAVKELTGREPMSVREFLSAHRAALLPAAQIGGALKRAPRPMQSERDIKASGTRESRLSPVTRSSERISESHLSNWSAGSRASRCNRPERRNALDQELLTELRDALQASAVDESVRVVLVTGAGKDFCSGMDLRTFADDASGDLAKFQAEARNMAGLLLDMRRHPRPIVAAVQGRALGGGCGIATAADIVLAADSAQFGYPEINIGFVPAIVMAILRRLVSEKRAFELIATGAVISAGAALEFGMINRVFAADTFEREVEEFVMNLASKSTSALTMAKELFYRTDACSLKRPSKRARM